MCNGEIEDDGINEIFQGIGKLKSLRSHKVS